MHNSISCSYPKTLFYSICFLLLITDLQSNSQSTATIIGTLENTPLTSVQLTNDWLYLGKNKNTDSSPLANGKFAFTINLNDSRLVELAAGDLHQNIFVEPGTNIQLQIKDSIVAYSGTGAEQNIFLQGFYAAFFKEYDDTLQQQKMLSTGVDAFEIALYESTKKQYDFLKNHAGKDKFSAAFTAYMQSTINYQYWASLLAYPIINANTSSKILTVNALPLIMLDGFDKVKVNNDEAINSASYRKFLKYYIIYFTSKNNGFNKFTDFSISADKKLTLAKEKLSGTAYKFWLAQFLTDECGRLSPYIIKKLYTELTEADKQNVYTKTVNEVCGERMAMKEEKKKDEVNTASASAKKYELELNDVDGKNVSLSDFKDKVVYIDFWASWCGPCRKNMPFSKQLHSNLSAKQKKKIVFLYISIDADPASWKKAKGDLGIEGVNVISPGNWKSPACAYFQINSIPRYMIMNKKGDIVDFNAPRPSDDAVMIKLLQLADE